MSIDPCMKTFGESYPEEPVMLCLMDVFCEDNLFSGCKRLFSSQYTIDSIV